MSDLGLGAYEDFAEAVFLLKDNSLIIAGDCGDPILKQSHALLTKVNDSV